MPMVSIRADRETNVTEFNVCLASGCVEYNENEGWVHYLYNERIIGHEENPVRDATIEKKIDLMKRGKYREYIDRLINDDVPKFSEANVPESVKNIFDIYKFFIDQCMKPRRYAGVKFEWNLPNLIYIYIRLRCEENRDGPRVIVDFESEKINERLTYYYEAETVDPVGVMKKEVNHVMGLFALFAEYVSQPIQEEGQGQGQGQNQQEGS
jgi:hypothetical protein